MGELTNALMSLLDPSITSRGAVLPIGRSAEGREWVVPGMIAEPANEIFGLLQMLGKGMTGERPIDLNTDAGSVARGMTNLVGTSGLASRFAGAVPKGAIGANVWQGGPHKYGPEGVAESLQHMGKGEGAQAYGWGRYDAGNPEVAEMYRRQLRFDRPAKVETPEEYALDALNYYGGNIETARDAIKETAKNPKAVAAPIAQKALDGFDDIVNSRQGNLYKHDLPDEDIARYLDWDKPLSEQPESVRTAVKTIADKHDPSGYINEMLDPMEARATTGRTIHRGMEDMFAMGGNGQPQKTVSLLMGEYGIPGLKYLDAMSRDADQYFPIIREGDNAVYQNVVGNQARAQAKLDELNKLGAGEVAFRLGDMVDNRSRNYVTWDQDVLNRMKLLERNGVSIADLLAGL